MQELWWSNGEFVLNIADGDAVSVSDVWHVFSAEFFHPRQTFLWCRKWSAFYVAIVSVDDYKSSPKESVKQSESSSFVDNESISRCQIIVAGKDESNEMILEDIVIVLSSAFLVRLLHAEHRYISRVTYYKNQNVIVR